jgi:hypothetical protein
MKPREQTTAQLAKALRSMANSIEQRDSFEGSISYEATEKPDLFEVQAFWRVGNSEGQGGSIMIGEDEI